LLKAQAVSEADPARKKALQSQADAAMARAQAIRAARAKGRRLILPGPEILHRLERHLSPADDQEAVDQPVLAGGDLGIEGAEYLAVQADGLGWAWTFRPPPFLMPAILSGG